MSWNMEAATGVPHAVCPEGTPSNVAALELYLPKLYQTTSPTVTEVGATNDHPTGAVGPDVLEGVAGAAED